MGKRGRKKKPTALKLVQGNPGKKALPAAEPKPKPVEAKRAPVPRGLTKEAKRVWRDLAPKLDALGLLTELDVRAMIRYCDLTVRWLKTKEHIEEHGLTVIGTNKAGAEYEMQSPYASLYLQLDKALSKIETQFGMSPASRTSIHVALPQSKKDEIKKKLYG